MKIEINKGKIIQIDKEDKPLIEKYRWNASPYVRATINGKRHFLHRYLMKPKEKQVVDHINGDILDNRKSNLRVCSNIDINSIGGPQVTGGAIPFINIDMGTIPRSPNG